MIELNSVSKFYNGKAAVDDVSLTIADGETLVLLGTSGCGKTTTLRMMNRLLEPDKGTVFINQKNIQDVPAAALRRSIGYVLQHTGLFPHYTVAENIAVVPKLLGWSNEKVAARTSTLLKKLQLDPSIFAGLYPAELSGGQQQRVGLARALAADPPVLLMDEPFGALDPITRVAIRRDFKHLEELQGKTIVMVTHDVQEAFELGDRVCLMNKGKIVQVGTPADLLFKPANDFVTAFLHDQKFVLELQAINVAELWDELEDEHLHPSNALVAGGHVWALLQNLPTNKTGVTIEHLGQRKTVTSASILQAVSQYKQRVYA